MELKNKRALVVGLGKSGMAAALFLKGRGARVTVSDTRSAQGPGHADSRACSRRALWSNPAGTGCLRFGGRT